MLSLQDYIINEVSSELLYRASDKARELSKNPKEKEFRTKQAARLMRAGNKKYDIERLDNFKENIDSYIKNGFKPKDRVELKNVLELSLKVLGRNADLNWIDVSNITDMSDLFDMLSPYNIKIDKWDVSKVTNMNRMFDGCKKFNCNLGNWDVSKVTDMTGMFDMCFNFKGEGLENWNVSNVEKTAFMFMSCDNFNADLSDWDLSKVKAKDMDCMFVDCKSLKNIPSWYKGRESSWYEKFK